MKETAYVLYNCANKLGLLLTLKPFGKNIKVSIPISKKFCERQITEINLSVRSSNALMRNGIDTVDKLTDIIMTEQGLSCIRNLGKKSINEIMTLMLVTAYDDLNERERLTFWQNFVRNNSMPETLEEDALHA